MEETEGEGDDFCPGHHDRLTAADCACNRSLIALRGVSSRTSCCCSPMVCMIIHVLLYQYRFIKSDYTYPHIADTEEGNRRGRR